jgi:hypothetical protein
MASLSRGSQLNIAIVVSEGGSKFRFLEGTNLILKERWMRLEVSQRKPPLTTPQDLYTHRRARAHTHTHTHTHSLRHTRRRTQLASHRHIRAPTDRG